MVSASTAPASPLSNMLRYMYAISRFHRSVLDFSYSSKKWLTFGAFWVHQKALARTCSHLMGSKFLCYTLCRLEIAVYAGKMGHEHETFSGRKPSAFHQLAFASGSVSG